MSSGDSRSLTLVGDWLESEARTKPELKDAFTELNGIVQKKSARAQAQQRRQTARGSEDRDRGDTTIAWLA